MNTPDKAADRLGSARHWLLTEVARLNLSVMLSPARVPTDEWTEITNAADELVRADTEYRTDAPAEPTRPDMLSAEGEPAKVFTGNEVLEMIKEWEDAARFNLEQARKDGKPELYYLGMVDTLAHVRDDFERRARNAW